MIDVRIPFSPDKRLGRAYNKAMETVEDWALFLDHDIFLLNERWYSICEAAIAKVGYAAGIISCLTNRIGCPLQRHKVFDSEDIKYHYGVSQDLAEQRAGELMDVTEFKKGLSGFFMLTHKQAWADAGGFDDNLFLGADTRYTGAVLAAGYKLFIMQDLYIYHRYWRLGL